MASSSLPLFRSLRLLRGLNVIGVGCALATLTGLSFGMIFGDSSETSWREAALATSVPTLAVGMVWAAMLRWRRRVGAHGGMRLGWLLSVPLAVVNATLAASLMFSDKRPITELLLMFVPMLLMCATVGAMFWLPALVATLALFGAPIAWAQRLARRGLAGEERGEFVVGATLAALSALGLYGVLLRPTLSSRLDQVVSSPSMPSVFGLHLPDAFAPWWLCGLATTGLVTGASAATLAWRRERRRRRFVADAEAGRAPGYRVEPTDDGKVLVRLARPALGEHGYRSEFADDEELFALDEQGLATHSAEELRQLPAEPVIEPPGARRP